MGVKFGREYDEIIDDMSNALNGIPGMHAWLEMAEHEWLELSLEEQRECLKTLADDVFFGLGSESQVRMGDGTFIYDSGNHIIKVSNGNNLITIIYLT